MLQSLASIADGFQVRVGTSLADVERQLILHTVQRCRTQDEAARILGISTKTLYNKLRLYEGRGRQRPAGPVDSAQGAGTDAPPA